jgi:hypothetical protein
MPSILIRSVLVLGAFACLALAACGIGKVGDSIDKVANNLQNIGTDMANGVGDFNSTAAQLKDILKDFPKEAGNELRINLEQVAQRTTQAAGIEARCTADFARKRIGEDILHIAASLKAKVLGKPEPERPLRDPMVCQPSPTSVRRDRIALNGTVVWDGYDLASIDPKGKKLGAALQKQGGQRSAVDILSMASEYQVVADLSRVQAQLTDDTVRLVLVWGEKVISEVSIEKPPGATRKTITAPLSPWGPKIAGHCPRPRNSHADGDFKGNGPKVTWSVTLSVSPDGHHLLAAISYHAIEWDDGKNREKDDFTEACGQWTETVYSAPAGQRIIRIIDDPRDNGSYVDTNHSDDTASGSLYARYALGGDGDGDDVGVFTKIAAPVQGKVQIEIEVPGS